MQDTTNPPRTAHQWSAWFWEVFFAQWLEQVQDQGAGVFALLDAEAKPDPSTGKTLLSQARTLFTLSHAAVLTDDPRYIKAAQQQVDFVARFRKAPGLYRCKLSRDGTPTGHTADEIARSYDQTFVILGLVTWNKIAPSAATMALVEDCWSALQTTLTDPATGLLRNDDTGADTGPAQNPHMHLFEACLQAYRVTDDTLWLTRAAQLRAIGLKHFMDQDSGSITEFLTPDLKPLPGSDGQRRETGHQCEWAWLLFEEARLANETNLEAPAKRLTAFAEAFGFAQSGILKGAVFDAVSADGAVMEDSFLLWPQTEAIKLLAIRHTAGDPKAGARAKALLCTMFERWFAGRPCFVNQLDAKGKTIWPEALTRLMYHLIIAMSEGAAAGLWPAAR